jgi:hypothetical protein
MIKKRLRECKITLCQLYEPSVLNVWEKYYGDLRISMVYCQDGMDGLIVVENT